MSHPRGVESSPSLKHPRWAWSVLALLTLGAAVTADDAYIITNDARLVDQPKNFGVKTVATPVVNTKVNILEGKVGDYNWAKVKTPDGAQGFIRGNALRDKPLEIATGSVQANDPKYAQNVGAAAKGWNSQIEKKNCDDDAAFKARIEQLNKFISFLDTRVRKTGKFREEIDKFYVDGGFEPRTFEDSALNQ